MNLFHHLMKSFTNHISFMLLGELEEKHGPEIESY